ncbi:aldo/keto reductase [Aggregatilinea lenta]|uniref:aldo/keto reductase n=1 Tax=Aggregatilinea lenta TaxID=913108 RepID=UPI000E5B1B0B|nr:aldo/keto reductase [Aggregatilinea lenta]
MECRKLGTSDLELTTLGLGTWALGGGDWQYGWGSQDDSESINTIHRALDLGMNWLDTAAVYGLGRSEEVVGKALRDRRDKVILATKCGQRWNDDGSTFRHSGPESLRREVEDSLRRLQTDHIDLYQIHWPDLDTPLEESWATLASFVKEGKVRYIGVSNYSAEQMAAIQSIHPITSLQPPYHLLERNVEDEILPFCRENNIGVVAYSPMASGLLTGRFDINRVAENDWRRGDSKFQEPQLSRNLAFVEALKPIAARQGKTVAHLAVAWTLRDPVVTSAIVGARSIAQAEQIMEGADYRLSEQDLADIDAAYQATL